MTIKKILQPLLMLIISFMILTTCSTSKKTAKSSTSKLFRIPQKVVKTDDLPEHLRNSDSNDEHVVQLFPDEKPEITKEIYPEPVIASKTEPKENKVENTYVEEAISPFIKKEEKEIFYHIVSGSFLTKLYAEMFVERLQRMGYANTYMKYADNGFYRVIVQKYPNEVEARQYLQGYRDDNTQYVTAWLFYKRNNNDGQLAFYQYN